MSQTFLKTMFGPRSRALQEIDGSRSAYARMETQADDIDILTDRELDFIAARDSFYLASLSEDGWPYVQHRGGPGGFLRQISGNRIAFADYRGNRQFLSTANLAADNRVCLFLMDYPARRRLKMIGHAHTTDDPAKVSALMVPGYNAVGERAFVVDIVGFDWNCPQHIIPRFTDAQVAEVTRPLLAELDLLRARISELEGL